MSGPSGKSNGLAAAALAPPASGRVTLDDAVAELDVARREFEIGVTRILETTQLLLSLEAYSLGAFRSSVRAHALELLETCAFEDIIGQRLAKAGRILAALQAGLAETDGPPVRLEAQSTAEARLRDLHLNGPGLAGPEVSQADINALFD